jgi:hypothetical protein
VPELQRIEVIPVEKINSKMRQCGVTFLFGAGSNEKEVSYRHRERAVLGVNRF